jgi:N-acetylneuraminate synthase
VNHTRQLEDIVSIGRVVPPAHHVTMIAEIGINHNGDLEIAKKLIRLAKNSGCDAVKFQKRTIDTVYTAEFLAGARESPWGTTQREQKEALEFGKAEFDEIDRYCGELGINWFASAWDVESQEFMRQYDCPYNKIASAMLTHEPLLHAIAGEGKLTYVSTGMSTYEDIDRAVAIFRERQCPFVLMHCVAEYPAPIKHINMQLMHKLRERYNCPVGYSGHEVGLVPSLMAAMMGAVAIERHITLDRAMYGSDQAASLERRGLELLTNYIRGIPIVWGDGEKRVLEGEKEAAAKLRYW